MPLDKTGFSIPDYTELLEQLSVKSKQIFGEKINTDQNSALGMWIRLIAWLQDIIYQDMQDTYLSNYIDQAEGTSLDQLGRNYSISRNVATNAQVTLEFTGTPNYVISADNMPLYATEDDIEFQLINDVQLDGDGKGSGEAVAVLTGPDGNVPANTITVPIDLLPDVYTVNNPIQSGGGADIETDESYRNRIHLSMDSQPGPTLKGLYTAISSLSGVQQVQIVQNLTMDKDVYGNPPKSLHFYVRGGGSQAIGEAILDNIAAGIQTVGSIKVSANDVAGHPHDIYYDEATVVPIYVTMNLKTNESYNQADSADDIRQAIKDYLSSVIMGGKVVFTRLYQAIYNVSGIDYVTVQMGRNSNNLGTSDIQLDQFETAIIDQDVDIEVNIDE